MRYIVWGLCLVTVAIIASCAQIEAMLQDDEDCMANCSGFAPGDGTVNIDVTIDSLNPEVTIEIFYGDVEDNELMEVRTLSHGSVSLTLPNGFYSVRATYAAMVDGEMVTIYSVDGAKLEADDYVECGKVCHREGEIDLDATLVSLKAATYLTLVTSHNYRPCL